MDTTVATLHRGRVDCNPRDDIFGVSDAKQSAYMRHWSTFRSLH